MKAAQKQANNDSKRSAINASESHWQNQLVQVADNSKAAVAQRAIIDGINDSPRMLAQRRQIEGYMDSGHQQASVPSHPTAQINQQQTVQQARKKDEEENNSLPGKFATQAPAQLEQQLKPQPNNTGLPDNLKSGIESLSGLSMDNVKVHYNSPQPAQINALAYAQGADIHLAPGQEQHLPHEAWHVVQQAQGRVGATIQLKNNKLINNEKLLEHEADEMGHKASHLLENRRQELNLLDSSIKGQKKNTGIYQKSDTEFSLEASSFSQNAVQQNSDLMQFSSAHKNQVNAIGVIQRLPSKSATYVPGLEAENKINDIDNLISQAEQAAENEVLNKVANHPHTPHQANYINKKTHKEWGYCVEEKLTQLVRANLSNWTTQKQLRGAGSQGSRPDYWKLIPVNGQQVDVFVDLTTVTEAGQSGNHITKKLDTAKSYGETVGNWQAADVTHNSKNPL